MFLYQQNVEVRHDAEKKFLQELVKKNGRDLETLNYPDYKKEYPKITSLQCPFGMRKSSRIVKTQEERMVEATKLKHKIKDTALIAIMINCRKKHSTKDNIKVSVFDGFKSSPNVFL